MKFIFVWVCLFVVGARAQYLDIDVRPHLERLGQLYERLHRGANNLMHWPLVIKRPKDTTPPIKLHPQTVLFSKSSSSSEVGSNKNGGLEYFGTDQDPISASGSEVNIQVLSPHKGEGKEFVNYVDNILKTSGGGGGGLYNLYSDGGISSGYKSLRPHQKPQSYRSVPPRARPSGNYYAGPQFSYRRPPPFRRFPPPNHKRPSKYSFKKPHPSSSWSAPRPKSPSISKGWGWAPKCDLATAEPIQINSLDGLPSNTVYTDGFGRPARLSDLAQSLVPLPPINFNLGVRSGIPEGYTLHKAELYDVTINPDGTTSVNKEVHNGPGTPPQMPKPRANSYQITSNIVISPKFAAPIQGTNSPFFMQALQNRGQVFREGPRHPFNTQMETLLQLFNDLETIEKEQEQKEAERKERNKKKGGWESSGGYSGGSSGEGGSFNRGVPAPLLVTMIQRFSLPEPNSSEPAVLDSAFNFGPQANRVSFGDMDIVTDAWKREIDKAAPPADLSGNSVEEVEERMNERIRSYVRGLRRATATSFNPLEDLAYGNLFSQEQYFIDIPGQCKKPVDPPHGRGPFGGMCGSGSIRMNAVIPCLPPNPACG